MGNSEDLARSRICDLGRRAYERGLIAGAEGNLSVRLADGRIVCTPRGACKGDLRPADLCILPSDAPRSQHAAGSDPQLANRVSSEIGLHLAIYAAGENVRAVVHLHPPYATTFAMLGETIPAGIVPEAELLLGEVPLVPYETPGTPAVGRQVAARLQGHVAAILQNHGTVTWAGDLDQAYLYSEALESVCRVLYQARLIGKPTPIPSERLAELRHSGRPR